MIEVFDTVSENLRFLRERELVKNEKVFTLTAIVPQRATSTAQLAVTSAWLNISGEGDFLIRSIQGSAQGPVTSAGVRGLSGNADTAFAMPGTTVPGGYAFKGLGMQIFDASNGRNLTTQLFHFTSDEPWIDVASVLSPGYAASGLQNDYFAPMPFEMFLPASSVLRFDFVNFDYAPVIPGEGKTTGYHRIDIALKGERFV